MKIEDIKFNDYESKYIQLAEYIKKLIQDDDIEDGEKLPTIRSLSCKINVNKATVISAYKKLEEEGYATSKIGSGTFAKKRDFTRFFRKQYSRTFRKLDRGRIKSVIDFTGETMSAEYFPIDEFKQVINEVLDRDGAEALIYNDSLGYEPLRKTIRKKFWDNSINLSDILIVSGAQQGIDIVAKTIVNANDNVVVEKPTYSGAISIFKSRRTNIIEVPIEEDGVNIDELIKILKKNKVKLFYTMSYFQNPSGVTISMEKKKKLISLAEEYDFYIVEDDYLSELIYNDNIDYVPMKRIDNYERVIYIKSFSKIFLPGIRLGYMISPKGLNENMQLSKINTDIATSSLMQRVLQSYIEDDYWIKHTEILTEEYKKRYICLINTINRILGDKVSFVNTGGGLHLFLKMKTDKIDSISLYNKLKKENVLITPGVLFFNNGNDGLKYFRIGFSEVDCDKIVKGIEIINKYI